MPWQVVDDEAKRRGRGERGGGRGGGRGGILGGGVKLKLGKGKFEIRKKRVEPPRRQERQAELMKR